MVCNMKELLDRELFLSVEISDPSPKLHKEIHCSSTCTSPTKAGTADLDTTYTRSVCTFLSNIGTFIVGVGVFYDSRRVK